MKQADSPITYAHLMDGPLAGQVVRVTGLPSPLRRFIQPAREVRLAPHCDVAFEDVIEVTHADYFPLHLNGVHALYSIDENRKPFRVVAHFNINAFTHRRVVSKAEQKAALEAPYPLPTGWAWRGHVTRDVLEPDINICRVEPSYVGRPPEADHV